MILFGSVLNDNKLNLKASDPHGGIPSGNSLCFALIPLLISFSDKLEFLIVCTRSSIDHPFMICNGSIIFPKDLLIFLPSLSLRMECRYMVLKGTFPVRAKLIITILATQKNSISSPVSNRSFGKKYL